MILEYVAGIGWCLIASMILGYVRGIGWGLIMSIILGYIRDAGETHRYKPDETYSCHFEDFGKQTKRTRRVFGRRVL